MVDLSVEFCGVKAPNPFWLASAPPTNSEYQVRRAFDAGWGGAVWKTIGHDPIVNVSSRYGAVDYDGRKVMGLNNIELITDRTLDVNLQEVARVKKAHPKHALFVSLMVESSREAWHDIVKRTQDAGAQAGGARPGQPRRLLRPRRQADRPAHGQRHRPRSADRRADQRHRRHPGLAGRRRVHAARRGLGSSLHRGDALRFPHHRATH